MRVSNTGTFYSGDAYATHRGTYGGCDIVATFTVPQLDNGMFIIGELHTLTYSVHDEKRPVRSFGFKNPKAFTSGPRTIAGTLIFSSFDRHVFRRVAEELRKKYAIGSHKITAALMADEMPPFNVTVTFANETGDASSLTLYGIQIVDEGQVMSIDDIVTENTMSYFALDMIPQDYIVRKQISHSEETDDGLYGNLLDANATSFDYYLCGKITHQNGQPILPETYITLTVTALMSDGSMIDASVQPDGMYFMYCKECPKEVFVYQNGVLLTTVNGTGHEIDIQIAGEI
jgi:hypothetical protein